MSKLESTSETTLQHELDPFKLTQYKSTLSSRIEAACKIKAISYAKLSRDIGQSESYVGNLVNENFVPRIEHVFKMAYLLDTDLIEDIQMLFHGELFPYTDVNTTRNSIGQYIEQEQINFEASDWFRENKNYSERVFTYAFNLPREYGTCFVKDSKMAGRHIMYKSTVVYLLTDIIDEDGALYCISTKKGEKLIREVTRKDDSYVLSSHKYNASSEFVILPKDRVTILGKAAYILTPVQDLLK